MLTSQQLAILVNNHFQNLTLIQLTMCILAGVKLTMSLDVDYLSIMQLQELNYGQKVSDIIINPKMKISDLNHFMVNSHKTNTQVKFSSMEIDSLLLLF